MLATNSNRGIFFPPAHGDKHAAFLSLLLSALSLCTELSAVLLTPTCCLCVRLQQNILCHLTVHSELTCKGASAHLFFETQHGKNVESGIERPGFKTQFCCLPDI